MKEGNILRRELQRKERERKRCKVTSGKERTLDLGSAGVSHPRVVDVSDLRLLGGREGERVARGHRQARGVAAGRVLSRHRGHQLAEEGLWEVEERPLCSGRPSGRSVEGSGKKEFEGGRPAFSEGRAARIDSSGGGS